MIASYTCIQEPIIDYRIYSGKFSHGSNFRVWVSYHENKNRESLNVRTTCVLILNSEGAKIKTAKISSGGDTGESAKFAPAKISRYTMHCMLLFHGQQKIEYH